MNKFANLVEAELASARKQHGKIAGAHDGYGRILEEVDEFWDWVKRRSSMRDRNSMCNELVQIAAMAQRTAEDLDLLP
jgi:hypothetical protein